MIAPGSVHDPYAAMAALGDPTRRAVFEALRRGPRAVGELAGTMEVSRPAVSQHLKVLKSAGLVVDTPVGTRRLYAVDPAGLAALRSYFDGFWDDVLGAFHASMDAGAVGTDDAPARATDR
jgi:DNA-binding transcriptional ArsR family regulator